MYCSFLSLERFLAVRDTVFQDYELQISAPSARAVRPTLLRKSIGSLITPYRRGWKRLGHYYERHTGWLGTAFMAL
jgi:hypothetical protein